MPSLLEKIHLQENNPPRIAWPLVLHQDPLPTSRVESKGGSPETRKMLEKAGLRPRDDTMRPIRHVFIGSALGDHRRSEG